MTLMFVGLALFFIPHLWSATPLRSALINGLGPARYKILFSLLSLAGLIIAVIGYRQVPVEYAFTPKPWARAAALHGMSLAFVLLAAANMPTHIRQWLKHPMMIGILIWSTLHYLANGEKAAVWLFGSFMVYSVISIISSSLRGQTLVKPGQVVAWKYDLMAVGGGIVVYGIVMMAHGWIFNRVLVPM